MGYTRDMRLDPDVCYRALASRDARFDGRFFTGVRTTGVYCRPVCPAPTPRIENCLFLPCAAAAQQAGFRPCLRCRPEASPGTPAWSGTSATVSRALRLISEGSLDDRPVDDLASRLGIGARQLRRLFVEHLGASPLAVAQTRRLLFARSLIRESSLPMSAVALASGFGSVRRFNEAIRRSFGCAPSALRPGGRSRRDASPSSAIVLRLPYRPPFRWRELVGFLAARAIPGVESADRDGYRRTVRVDGDPGVIQVRPVAGANHLVASIFLPRPAVLLDVAERCRRIFDVGADPEPIARRLDSDPRLRSLTGRVAGLRLPGAWDGFEVAVRAILGQQVSVAAASRLSGRLVDRFGDPLGPGPDSPTDGLTRLFPLPERLARADLTRIGIPRSRARAVNALASAVADGVLDLEASRSLEETVAALVRIPGVGDWTAQYIAMRALGEPDAFPAGDLGLRRALARGGRPLTRRSIEETAEAWRPWRAYAAIALWGAASRPGTRRRGDASRAG